MSEVIYLDYNASTPVDPEVVAALSAELGTPGNAASTDHVAGARARARVEEARGEVARLIGAQSEEIVFTSGATEADNIAVLGTLARTSTDAALIVSAVEHPAVLEPARRSAACVTAPVDKRGVIDIGALADLITDTTGLVSVMSVNNETGVIQPVAAVGELCAERGVTLHVDAAQAGARLALDVESQNISLLSLSAHKMYGPQGVGALYVRRRPRLKLAPLNWGGGHERGLRPGTLNVAGIVGFGVAARLARERRDADAAREAALAAQLEAGLAAAGAIRNTPREVTLAHTLSLRFTGVSGRALLHAVNGRLAFSTGSACATIKNEPSHVLAAQGLDRTAVAESVRLSLGRFTTEREIKVAAGLISEAVAALRAVGAAAA